MATLEDGFGRRSQYDDSNLTRDHLQSLLMGDVKKVPSKKAEAADKKAAEDLKKTANALKDLTEEIEKLNKTIKASAKLAEQERKDDRKGKVVEAGKSFTNGVSDALKQAILPALTSIRKGQVTATEALQKNLPNMLDIQRQGLKIHQQMYALMQKQYRQDQKELRQQMQTKDRGFYKTEGDGVRAIQAKMADMLSDVVVKAVRQIYTELSKERKRPASTRNAVQDRVASRTAAMPPPDKRFMSIQEDAARAIIALSNAGLRKGSIYTHDEGAHKRLESFGSYFKRILQPLAQGVLRSVRLLSAQTLGRVLGPVVAGLKSVEIAVERRLASVVNALKFRAGGAAKSALGGVGKLLNKLGEILRINTDGVATPRQPGGQSGWLGRQAETFLKPIAKTFSQIMAPTMAGFRQAWDVLSKGRKDLEKLAPPEESSNPPEEISADILDVGDDLCECFCKCLHFETNRLVQTLWKGFRLSGKAPTPRLLLNKTGETTKATEEVVKEQKKSSKGMMGMWDRLMGRKSGKEKLDKWNSPWYLERDWSHRQLSTIGNLLENEKPIQHALNTALVGHAVGDMISSVLPKTIGKSVGNMATDVITFITGPLTKQMDFFQDLRQTAFETMGTNKGGGGPGMDGVIGGVKQQEEALEKFQVTSEDVLMTNQALTMVQTQWLKNMKRGIRDAGTLRAVTTTGLATGRLVGANAEETANFFADMAQNLQLSNNELSNMGRGLRQVARETGVTGDNLIQIAKSSEQFMKSMQRSGTFTSTAGKNVTQILAQASTMGTTESVTSLLGELSRNIFTEGGDEKTKMLALAASGRGRSFEQLQSGTLLQSRQGMKDFALGLEDLLNAFTHGRKIADMDAMERQSIDAALQTTYGKGINELTLTIETLKKATRTFSEKYQELEKLKPGLGLTQNEIDERKRAMAFGQVMEYLTEFGKSLDGVATVSDGLKRFAKNELVQSGEFAKDLKSLGIDGTGPDAISGLLMKAIESVNKQLDAVNMGNRKINPQEIAKAINSPDGISKLLSEIGEADRVSSVALKAMQDPISRIEASMKNIESILRTAVGDILVGAGGAADFLANNAMNADWFKKFQAGDTKGGFEGLKESISNFGATAVEWRDQIKKNTKLNDSQKAWALAVATFVEGAVMAAGWFVKVGEAISWFVNDVLMPIGKFLGKIFDFLGLDGFKVAAVAVAIALTNLVIPIGGVVRLLGAFATALYRATGATAAAGGGGPVGLARGLTATAGLTLGAIEATNALSNPDFENKAGTFVGQKIQNNGGSREAGTAGDIVEFAALGAMIGGPVGAVGGAIIGSAITINKAGELVDKAREESVAIEKQWQGVRQNGINMEKARDKELAEGIAKGMKTETGEVMSAAWAQEQIKNLRDIAAKERAGAAATGATPAGKRPTVPGFWNEFKNYLDKDLGREDDAATAERVRKKIASAELFEEKANTLEKARMMAEKIGKATEDKPMFIDPLSKRMTDLMGMMLTTDQIQEKLNLEQKTLLEKISDNTDPVKARARAEMEADIKRAADLKTLSNSLKKITDPQGLADVFFGDKNKGLFPDSAAGKSAEAVRLMSEARTVEEHRAFLGGNKNYAGVLGARTWSEKVALNQGTLTTLYKGMQDDLDMLAKDPTKKEYQTAFVKKAQEAAALRKVTYAPTKPEDEVAYLAMKQGGLLGGSEASKAAAGNNIDRMMLNLMGSKVKAGNAMIPVQAPQMLDMIRTSMRAEARDIEPFLTQKGINVGGQTYGPAEIMAMKRGESETAEAFASRLGTAADSIEKTLTGRFGELAVKARGLRPEEAKEARLGMATVARVLEGVRLARMTQGFGSGNLEDIGQSRAALMPFMGKKNGAFDVGNEEFVNLTTGLMRRQVADVIPDIASLKTKSAREQMVMSDGQNVATTIANLQAELTKAADRRDLWGIKEYNQFYGKLRTLAKLMNSMAAPTDNTAETLLRYNELQKEVAKGTGNLTYKTAEYEEALSKLDASQGVKFLMAVGTDKELLGGDMAKGLLRVKPDQVAGEYAKQKALLDQQFGLAKDPASINNVMRQMAQLEAGKSMADKVNAAASNMTPDTMAKVLQNRNTEPIKDVFRNSLGQIMAEQGVVPVQSKAVMDYFDANRGSTPLGEMKTQIINAFGEAMRSGTIPEAQAQAVVKALISTDTQRLLAAGKPDIGQQKALSVAVADRALKSDDFKGGVYKQLYDIQDPSTARGETARMRDELSAELEKLLKYKVGPEGKMTPETFAKFQQVSKDLALVEQFNKMILDPLGAASHTMYLAGTVFREAVNNFNKQFDWTTDAGGVLPWAANAALPGATSGYVLPFAADAEVKALPMINDDERAKTSARMRQIMGDRSQDDIVANTANVEENTADANDKLDKLVKLFEDVKKLMSSRATSSGRAGALEAGASGLDTSYASSGFGAIMSDYGLNTI